MTYRMLAIIPLAVVALIAAPRQADAQLTRSTVGTSAPDQSAVALKAGPAAIPAGSDAVKAALAPSDVAGAMKLAGKPAAVVGTVVEAYSPKSHAVVFLDFSKQYKRDITVAAFRSDFAKLPDLKALAGQRVLVSGTVKIYEGKPEIELTSAKQIAIVK